jgi:hypothetical protein
MGMEFKKAERSQSKLRLALQGPAGSGKTLSALYIALGLGGKIGMADTEKESGSLYSDKAEYDILVLTAPFTPERYIEAIKTAEVAGYEVLIIDSISHEWFGEGGCLEMHDKIASASGNSFTAWNKVTPRHNKFVEAMLQSPCHIIATMRSKDEYAQVQGDDGKAKVKKLGMAPIQRGGMDYEFTVVLDLTTEHLATATKDRTGLFDGQMFIPTVETGKQLLAWLMSAKHYLPMPSKAELDEFVAWVGEKKLVQADVQSALGGKLQEWLKTKTLAEARAAIEARLSNKV